jgi:hypothetical protein
VRATSIAHSSAVVLHPEQQVPPFQVEQGSELSRDPLRAQIIPLEFDT